MIYTRDMDRITTTQAGAILGLHQTTLYRWAKAGKFPAYRVGRKGKRFAFDRATVEMFARTGAIARRM